MAGVCAGIGRWLGVEPLIVRIAFVVLALSGAVGVVVYVVMWALLPEHGQRSPLPLRDGGRRLERSVAVGLLALGSLLLVRESGFWLGDKFVWPLALAAMGVALTWPEWSAAQDSGERVWRLPTLRGEPFVVRPVLLLRLTFGVGAVAGGVTIFAVANADFSALGDAALAAFLTVAGLLLIFGPWWWRLGRNLVEERRRRIRSDERAEVAARIHDSVLQTLTLIQQKSHDPQETARLARRQERELRGWLFETQVPEPGSVRAAVLDAAAEVEDLYGVTVDVVTVGDAPCDTSAEALVAAAKEAVVNAAKFSDEERVSMYVEVDDAALRAYVRDRGAGFDPENVPDDRRGIAESIVGRMARHGGDAVVRSAPGEGTEVELTLPRARA